MVIGHELYGTGPHGVIVMHDFYGCRDTWAFARPFFDTRNFSFAFVEVRGYGASRNIPGEYTPAEAAADVLALADNLAWERFHVVGHSMSGMLAQRVVLDGGNRVQSAVLNTPVAASGLSFSPEGLAVITASIENDDALSQAFDVLTGNRLSREWRDFKIRQTRASRSKAAQAGYLKNLAEQGFSTTCAGIRRRCWSSSASSTWSRSPRRPPDGRFWTGIPTPNSRCAATPATTPSRKPRPIPRPSSTNSCAGRFRRRCRCADARSGGDKGGGPGTVSMFRQARHIAGSTG